jgi:hypothetical protein
MLYDDPDPQFPYELHCLLWACALALAAWLVIHFSTL